MASSSHRSSSSRSSRYDDGNDDIVDTRQGSGHHHHHHHRSGDRYSGSNSLFQSSAATASSLELFMRRLPWMVARIVAFAVLAVLCWTFWKQNAQLKRDIRNYEGSNLVASEQIKKLEGEKETIALEVENLKREIEELKDVNRVLREAVDKASGAAE